MKRNNELTDGQLMAVGCGVLIGRIVLFAIAVGIIAVALKWVMG